MTLLVLLLQMLFPKFVVGAKSGRIFLVNCKLTGADWRLRLMSGDVGASTIRTPAETNPFHIICRTSE